MSYKQLTRQNSGHLEAVKERSYHSMKSPRSRSQSLSKRPSSRGRTNTSGSRHSSRDHSRIEALRKLSTGPTSSGLTIHQGDSIRFDKDTMRSTGARETVGTPHMFVADEEIFSVK